MNEIQKYDTFPVAPFLLPDEKQYVLDNMTSPKIKEIEKKELVKMVQKIYAKCKIETHMNLKESPEDEITIALLVTDDLLKFFKTLTIKEVQKAFRNGARHLYGEYQFLSVALFFKWVQNFQSNAQRVMVLKKQRAWNESLQEKKLTNEEKKQLIIDGIRKNFGLHKAGEYYNDLNNHCYDYLDTNGLIPSSSISFF